MGLQNAVVNRQRSLELSSGASAIEQRVLVIYCGGTIGMLSSPQGYVPTRGFLYDNLRTQSRFNDPEGIHLPNHSRSIEDYQSWAASPAAAADISSGQATPSKGETKQVPTQADLSARLNAQGPTLPVHTNTGVKQLPCLVTPKNFTGQRLKYVIYEYEKLIDSSEVGLEDFIRIAEDVERNYQHFDAFLILHGTDTLSYTASSLSFLLENLGKTVIISGAQIPVSEVRNDGLDNLLGGLTIARSYTIPEVSVFFNNQLFRGNRTMKASSFDFDAFSSPNFQPLCTVGVDIAVHWERVLRPTALQPMQVHKQLCPNVARFALYPGVQTSTLKAVLAAPTQALVLETYGAGNSPQRKDFLDALKEATERGVIIVNITQCSRGSVVDLYSGGRALLQAGLISGHDMTVECALAKLQYLLGRSDLSTEEIRHLMGRPLRGELTPPTTTKQYSPAMPLDRLPLLLSQLMSASTSSSTTQPSSSEHSRSRQPSSEEASAASETLVPYLLAQAASKDDDSLETMLVMLVGSVPNESANESVAGNFLNQSASTGCPISPLHLAASSGSIRNTTLLLKYGASVHVRDTGGNTALFCAAKHGHTSVVQVLRAAGAHLGDGEVGSGDVDEEVSRAHKVNDMAKLEAWDYAKQ